jgi:hypothetical protein
VSLTSDLKIVFIHLYGTLQCKNSFKSLYMFYVAFFGYVALIWQHLLDIFNAYKQFIIDYTLNTF